MSMHLLSILIRLVKGWPTMPLRASVSLKISNERFTTYFYERDFLPKYFSGTLNSHQLLDV